MKLLVLLASVVLCTVAAVPEEVAISNFGFGVLEKDEPVKVTNVAVFSKHSKPINAKQGQRFYVKFGLKGKSGAEVAPEQVFLLLQHSSGKDVVFVLNKEGSDYVFDQTLRGAVLKNLSGNFKASLLVGGSGIKTAVNWHFADVSFDVPTVPVVIPKTQQVNYEPLPEIQHIFRQPEKRPSAIISDAFSVICALPLLGLIFAWLQIGINFENAPASLWTPIFHVGLALIFGLYFIFWLQLDMFETLKYLAILGFVTFIAGNRVLRSIADKKTKTA